MDSSLGGRRGDGGGRSVLAGWATRAVAPGSTAAGSKLHANPAASPFVPTTSTEAPSIINYTQASKLLAGAQDPGLPAVVAKVNGWVITGREVAQMEAVLATHNTPIGSAALRRAAFQAILDPYVQIQAAIKQTLLSSLTWARAQARSHASRPPPKIFGPSATWPPWCFTGPGCWAVRTPAARAP